MGGGLDGIPMFVEMDMVGILTHGKKTINKPIVNTQICLRVCNRQISFSFSPFRVSSNFFGRLVWA